MGGAITEPTLEQKKGIFDIVVSELAKSSYKQVIGDLQFSSDSYIIRNNGVELPVDNEKGNWIDRIYIYLSKDRKEDYGTFYSFKKFNRAMSIIKNKSLPLLSLNSQSDNDYAELSEYHQRYANAMNPYSGIEQYKNNTFICCFTKSLRNERFWKEYADNDSGVAIGFRFDSFNNHDIYSMNYEFRDVFYDEGYALDFYNEIKFKIYKEYKINFNLNPYETQWFPHFYKRRKYEWEDETRLAISGSSFGKYLHRDAKEFFDEDGKFIEKFKILEQPYSTKEINGKRLIELPFNNIYFNIKIDEIICGKNITEKEMEEIKEHTKEMDIFVWKRK